MISHAVQSSGLGGVHCGMRNSGEDSEAMLPLRWSRDWLSWRGWKRGLYSSGAEIWRWRRGVLGKEESALGGRARVVVLDLWGESRESMLAMLPLRESSGVDASVVEPVDRPGREGSEDPGVEEPGVGVVLASCSFAFSFSFAEEEAWNALRCFSAQVLRAFCTLVASGEVRQLWSRRRVSRASGLSRRMLWRTLLSLRCSSSLIFSTFVRWASFQIRRSLSMSRW